MTPSSPQQEQGGHAEEGLSVKCLETVAEVPAEHWNALVDPDHPFARHEFLDALEATGAVGEGTGWQPRHLTLWRGARLVGLLPYYLKEHSWGEYVFDWSWADAWERAGGRYYPKAVSAIPFTPAPGPRLALAEGEDEQTVMAMLASQWQDDPGLSGWHLLFAEDSEVAAWRQACPGLIARSGVQFQWRDEGFGDFEGFLAAMTSKRRKEVRRERRRVADQGIELRRLEGSEIDEAAIRHFFRCYRITYFERGTTGYLSEVFFQRLRRHMPENLVLVQAFVEGRPVAAALCLQGTRTLYGRYWGSEVLADCLHFEACYYQGIEHCLARGLDCFDPGTQGEHKVSRGFVPRRLTSLHHVNDPRLNDAVARFCQEEARQLELYVAAAHRGLPFRGRA
ncbi:GNAT family N-acetyltransferase [Halomonas sp. DP5N14-9]|uniref:GNAT family N-acetyltransferase n=1 Tax=Halomonas sp. DP5N14-9 TaxID=2859075 RepID=UPI0039657105